MPDRKSRPLWPLLTAAQFGLTMLYVLSVGPAYVPPLTRRQATRALCRIREILNLVQPEHIGIRARVSRIFPQQRGRGFVRGFHLDNLNELVFAGHRNAGR